jgi:phospholipase/carboxylesterase
MRTSRRSFLRQASALLGAAGLARRALADDLGPGQYPLGLDHERDGLLYLPRGYKAGVPMPLLTLFHGAGGTAQSVPYAFPMADRHGVIILAPDSRDQRTWDLVLGAYGPDADFLSEALGQTLKRCSVDRQRLAVGGHSDGASYALSFGIGAGDVFTTILAFSPGVMTPLAARGKPRIFISHGVSDNVMPIDDTSRRFVPRLKGLGYDVQYREYEGRHPVPPEVVEEGFAWGFQGR